MSLSHMRVKTFCHTQLNLCFMPQQIFFHFPRISSEPMTEISMIL